MVTEDPSEPADEDESQTGDEEQKPLVRVEEALADIISLCSRSSHGLNQLQREVLQHQQHHLQ